MELGGMNYHTREKRPPNTLGEETTKPQKMRQKANDPFSFCGYNNKHVTGDDPIRCMAELARGLRITSIPVVAGITAISASVSDVDLPIAAASRRNNLRRSLKFSDGRESMSQRSALIKAAVPLGPILRAFST